MFEFFIIIYFGFNFAFALFVVSDNDIRNFFGIDVNMYLLFIANLFFGVFVFSYFLSRNNGFISNRRNGAEEDSNGFVRVFNDFSNFSF